MTTELNATYQGRGKPVYWGDGVARLRKMARDAGYVVQPLAEGGFHLFERNGDYSEYFPTAPMVKREIARLSSPIRGRAC